jgi:hypothetical protein
VFQVVGYSIPLNEGEFGPDQSRAVDACRENTTEGEQLRSMVLLRHHYTSVATSFDTSSLDVIARHATKRYYEAPSEYIADEWGADGLPGFKPTQFTEQDGLLNRDTQLKGWWTLSPRCPRAFHAGFTGYNRLVAGMDRGGSDAKVQFFTRFEELSQMTPEQMIDQASRRCKDCHDVIPVPLSGYYASRLVYCAELADSHGKDSGKCNPIYKGRPWPPAMSALEAAAAKEAEDAIALSTAPPPPLAEQCTDGQPSIFHGRDIRGHDLHGVPAKRASSATQCCLRCAQLAEAADADAADATAGQDSRCGGWVWIPDSGACYLKDSRQGQGLGLSSLSNNGGAVAGLLLTT